MISGQIWGWIQMLEVVPTRSFKKDLKKYQHKKDILKELYEVISILAKEEKLEAQKKDHYLKRSLFDWYLCQFS